MVPGVQRVTNWAALAVGWNQIKANALSSSSLSDVRPVWVSSRGPVQDEENGIANPRVNNNLPKVIFLHGRLEAEAHEPPFAAPRELYRDFLQDLAKAFDCDNDADNDTPSVLMLEYETLLAQELPHEPRDLSLGPISRALAAAIEAAVEDHQQLVLVSFSMGAAMALKLLYDTGSAWNKSLTNVVLIAPVWRCWLPFALSRLTSPSEPHPKVLALYGTSDDQTKVDSGGSVKGALRPLVPSIETMALDGGNHWGILTESVAGESLTREGMGANTTPQQLQSDMIQIIASFCGCQPK